MPKAVLSFATIDNPESLLEALLPDIRDAVSSACYHYFGNQCDIEDFYHQVIVLLMEDDYHRLRSFARKSSAKTWLTVVAMHCVSNHIRRQKEAISLDESGQRAFVCEPTQESRLISEEKRCGLREAVSKLTPRERKLLELLSRDDLSSADVAKQMGIKVESVRRRKHALIKKLQALINWLAYRTEAPLEK